MSAFSRKTAATGRDWGKPAKKRLGLWPNLWPLRSACTDFVEATSIHHILAKILEQLWPEIGWLLLRPRVPGHVGSTTEAEIRMHWLRLRLTRHWQRHETAQRWYHRGGGGQCSRWRHLAEVLLLYVHRNRRFIRDGSPGRPHRLSHGSWDLVMATLSLGKILKKSHGARSGEYGGCSSTAMFF